MREIYKLRIPAADLSASVLVTFFLCLLPLCVWWTGALGTSGLKDWDELFVTVALVKLLLLFLAALLAGYFAYQTRYLAYWAVFTYLCVLVIFPVVTGVLALMEPMPTTAFHWLKDSMMAGVSGLLVLRWLVGMRMAPNSNKLMTDIGTYFRMTALLAVVIFVFALAYSSTSSSEFVVSGNNLSWFLGIVVVMLATSVVHQFWLARSAINPTLSSLTIAALCLLIAAYLYLGFSGMGAVPEFVIGSLFLETFSGLYLFAGLIIHLLDKSESYRKRLAVMKKTNAARKAEIATVEKHMAGITDKVPVLLAYIDRQRRYQFVNKTHERLIGKPVSSFIGRYTKDQLSEEHFETLKPHLDKALLGEETTFDVKLTTDAGPLYLKGTYLPDKDSYGVVQGVFCCFENVTRLVKARRELQDMSWRTDFAMKVAGIGIWEMDLNSRELVWDGAMRDLFRRSELRYPYRDWLNLFHPEDRRKLDFGINRAMHGHNDLVVSLRVLLPDGDCLWVHCHGRLTTHGAHKGLVGICYDVTQRTRAEMALEERSAQLELVMDSTNIGIWDWRREAGVIEVNSRYAEILGYTLEELTPYTIARSHELTHPDDLAETQQVLSRYVRGKIPSYIHEFRIRHKDGRWVWISSSGKIIEKSSDGRVARMIGTFLDVTEHKNANLDLIRAREQAEAANKAKSDFLANISHELRTPMNGIVGMLRLLNKSELDFRQEEQVGAAMGSADAMLGLINNLVDMSTIKKGNLDIRGMDFDLLVELEDIASDYERQAKAKGLLFEYEIGQLATRWVRGDPNRIRQVFDGLLGNALKFTSEGMVSVWVSLSRLGTERYLLECHVRDTGIGIEPQKVDQLFSAFSQGETGRARHYEGAGLGLALVRSICEQLGGGVSAISEPGRGSTFKFTLNLESSGRDHAISSGGMKTGKTAMVLSGDVQILDQLTGFLLGRDIEFHIVKNAKSALLTLEQLSQEAGAAVDYLFLDSRVADIKPTALVRMIKSDDRYVTTQVVLLVAEEGEDTEGHSAHFDHFVRMKEDVGSVRDELEKLFGSNPVVVNQEMLANKAVGQLARNDPEGPGH